MIKSSIVAAVASIVLILSGCSASDSSSDDLNSANVAKASRESLAAVFISAQGKGINLEPENQKSFLAMFEPGGQSKTMQGAPMMGPRLLWCDGSLMYADSKYDYFIGDSLTRREHKKPDEQINALCAGAGKFSALYNDGYSDKIYEMMYTTSSAGGHHKQTIAGDYLATGVFGNELYGIASVGNDEDDKGIATRVFSRISAMGSKQKSAVSVSSKFRSPGIVGDLIAGPGQRMYALSSRLNSNNPQSSIAIDSWSINTGQYSSQLLVDKKKTPLQFSDDSYATHKATGIVLDSQVLYWFGPDGRAWATNLKTGVTEQPYSVDRNWLTRANTFFSFVGETVGMLYVDDSEDWHLKIFDVRSGKEKRTVALPRIKSLIAGYRWVEAFSLNPTVVNKLG